MNNITKRISIAKHVVVIASMDPSADSLGGASAMYLYLLQQHKKVSFFCKTKNLNQKYSYLPWFEKIRTSLPSSVDLAISFDCHTIDSIGHELNYDLININNSVESSLYGEINLVDFKAISTTHIVYNFLKFNNVNITPKLATSLYSGILEKSEGLLSSKVTGELFGILKELRECGGDFIENNKKIISYQTLAGLRLKAIMLKNMQLHCNAKVALFILSKDNLVSSGVKEKEYLDLLHEALCLPTVKTAVVVKENLDGSKTCLYRAEENVHLALLLSTFGAIQEKEHMKFIINKNENIFEMSNKIINIIQKEI